MIVIMQYTDRCSFCCMKAPMLDGRALFGLMIVELGL